MKPCPDIGHAIAAAARAINQRQSLDETLQAIAELARDSVPGFDEVVSVPRVRHDRRWPRYVPAAVEAGLRSQLAVKLHLDDEGTLGGLNLYSTTSDGPSAS